jgi:tRNA G10  N-methylase Trm11
MAKQKLSSKSKKEKSTPCNIYIRLSIAYHSLYTHHYRSPFPTCSSFLYYYVRPFTDRHEKKNKVDDAVTTATTVNSSVRSICESVRPLKDRHEKKENKRDRRRYDNNNNNNKQTKSKTKTKTTTLGVV